MSELSKNLGQLKSPDQSAVVVLEPYDKFKATGGSEVFVRMTVTDNCTTCCYARATNITGGFTGGYFTPDKVMIAAAPKPTLSGDLEPLLANARQTIASPGFDGFSALRDLKALVAALSSPLLGEQCRRCGGSGFYMVEMEPCGGVPVTARVECGCATGEE